MSFKPKKVPEERTSSTGPVDQVVVNQTIRARPLQRTAAFSILCPDDQGNDIER